VIEQAWLIPVSVYEAARIDGAATTFAQTFAHLT
jgi:ABC-type sugar transport system permease subunit